MVFVRDYVVMVFVRDYCDIRHSLNVISILLDILKGNSFPNI